MCFGGPHRVDARVNDSEDHPSPLNNCVHCYFVFAFSLQGQTIYLDRPNPSFPRLSSNDGRCPTNTWDAYVFSMPAFLLG